MNKYFILLFLVSLSISSFGQPWQQNMDEKKSKSAEGDFYILQDAFKEYWQDREIEKGKGWKQFKRWEYFMEPRVYPKGEMELPFYTGKSISLKKSSNDLANWSSLGPDVVPDVPNANRKAGAGRLNTIAFHPTNPNILYVGAPSGGIWKSINGGVSWISLGNDLESLGVSGIAINPQNPDIIYIATGDGDAGDTYASGILKSTNGGNSWIETSFNLEVSETYYFRNILIDPTNSNILWATSNKGIFRSTDGFASYSRVLSGHFKDIEFHPANPDIVYATKYSSDGDAKIIRIKEDATSIQILDRGIDLFDNVNRVELAVTPARPDALYALASSKTNGGFYGLYKSEDQGDNWSKIYDSDELNLLGWSINGSDNGGQGWYDLSLAVDPDNENIIFVGGVNIWGSKNGGSSFEIKAHWIGQDEIDYVHADHHYFAYSPLTKELFSCNDGGLYKTSDMGETWTDLSESLNILQIYNMSVSRTSFDLFLTGNQDNGSYLRKDNIWTEVTGGDGMDNIIKFDNPDKLISSYYYGSFWLSEDGGENFIAIGPEEERGSGAWVTPIVPSEKNPDHIFVAYKNVYKSVNFGKIWINLSDNLDNTENFRSLSVSPSDENYIYASSYSKSYRTRNGGKTWELISSELPSVAIKSIAVSPNNPEKIWISFSGFSEGKKVYYSENAGDNWVNYSEGIPNIPTNIIKMQSNKNGALYLGTDHGVYYRDNSKAEWELFNNGLPNVVVNDIEFQEKYDRITIGSYGRGIWESSFYPVESSVITGEIHPLYKYGCVGNESRFYIKSMNQTDSVQWNFNDEVFVSSMPEDTVAASFSSSGIKNIFATVFKNGDSKEFDLKNYFSVKEDIQLSVWSTDTSNYHSNDDVFLLADGANNYEWSTGDFNYEITNPYSSVISAATTDTITFYVKASIGSCMAVDSFTINVIPGPINDNYCNPISLELGMNGPFDNYQASYQKGEPVPEDMSDCNTQSAWCDEGGVQNSVWFKYVADNEITSITTKGFDTQIAIYQADSCKEFINKTFDFIAANDDYFGEDKAYAAAIHNVSLEIGKSYWIQVDGSGGGQTGTFTILVSNDGVGIESENINPDINVRIFPNPAKDLIKIQYNSTSASSIEIFSIKGEKILDRKIQYTGFINEQVNLNEKGFYVLRIKTKNSITNRRLIVE